MYPWAQKTAVCFHSPSVKGVQFHCTCCCCWIWAHPSIQKGINLSTILLDRDQCPLFVLFDAISRPSYVWPVYYGSVFLNLLNNFTELAVGRQGHIFEANGECNLRWCYPLQWAARRRYMATIAALQHRAKTREAIFKIRVVISKEHLVSALIISPWRLLMQIASDGKHQETTLQYMLTLALGLCILQGSLHYISNERYHYACRTVFINWTVFYACNMHIMIVSNRSEWLIVRLTSDFFSNKDEFTDVISLKGV